MKTFEKSINEYLDKHFAPSDAWNGKLEDAGGPTGTSVEIHLTTEQGPISELVLRRYMDYDVRYYYRHKIDPYDEEIDDDHVGFELIELTMRNGLTFVPYERYRRNKELAVEYQQLPGTEPTTV